MEQKYTLNLNLEELAKDPNELTRFLVNLDTIEQYPYLCEQAIYKIENDFMQIGPKYLEKLSFDYHDRIKSIRDSIAHNLTFLTEVLKKYKPDMSYYQNLNMEQCRHRYYLDVMNIFHSLYYIIRDWTSEREEERKSSYGTIIQEITKYFKPNSGKYKFLVPGAGLNRLGYDICQLGFDVEANDYSYYNAIFWDYIVNHSTKNQNSYINLEKECFLNRLTEESIYRKFSFPDVDINKSNKENQGKLTMSIGNFVKQYDNKKDLYDCVVTCFFIDTAKNILEYIEIIHNILKKGGIWINLGPLSYHWTTFPQDMSIELPYDLLKKTICNFEFEYLHEETKDVIYCQVQDGLKNYIFKAVLFTVKKK